MEGLPLYERRRKHYRVIKDLLWVTLSEKSPWSKSRARLRGAKARGRAYENKFGVWLERQNLPGTLFAHQWLAFEDENGVGYAQPDYFILRPDNVLLLECKLSQVDSAWDQLELLYAPLLGHLFSRPCIPVQVCKNLRATDGVVTSIMDARPGSVFHWLP